MLHSQGKRALNFEIMGRIHSQQ